jgi:hypothetical protein
MFIGGYVYGERWRRQYLGYGEYPFAGEDVQSSMILDK